MSTCLLWVWVVLMISSGPASLSRPSLSLSLSLFSLFSLFPLLSSLSLSSLTYSHPNQPWHFNHSLSFPPSPTFVGRQNKSPKQKMEGLARCRLRICEGLQPMYIWRARVLLFSVDGRSPALWNKTLQKEFYCVNSILSWPGYCFYCDKFVG